MQIGTRFLALAAAFGSIAAVWSCATGSSVSVGVGDSGGSRADGGKHDGSREGGTGSGSGTLKDANLSDTSDGSISCEGGLMSCEGKCVQTATDPDNCGGCGRGCNGLLCSGGMCVTTCAPPDAGEAGVDGGQLDTECPGGDGGSPHPHCTNLQTDPDNCGMCGHACSAGANICVSGVCVLGCPAGQVVCNDFCIGDTDCCTNASCPTVPNTTATSCPTPGGMCDLTCTATCFNSDGVYSNGCECCEDTNTTCGGTDLGSVAMGGTASGTGHLPGPTSVDWFTVTFTGQGTLTFHPAVTLTGDAGIVFSIYTSCAGGGTVPLTCGNEGGNCSGVTTWETEYTCQTGATPCTTASPMFAAIGVTTIYVKVTRDTGSPTCNPYTLSVSN